MAAVSFDSKAVKKQARLLEGAADQIQNRTVKVMNVTSETMAAS